ncbi:DDE-type integrase/transposase/recombinase [Flavobacterium sp. RS13.1]
MYETCVKVKGISCYLYRSVDQFDDTVDFLLIKSDR